MHVTMHNFLYAQQGEEWNNESSHLAYYSKLTYQQAGTVRLKGEMGFAVKLALFLTVSACIFAEIESTCILENNWAVL